MYDLTAPIETYGTTPDITHVDLYYKGTVLAEKTLATDCVLLDLSAGAEKIDPAKLAGFDRIRPGNSVILKTGWEKFRGTERYAQSPWVDRGLLEALVARGAVLVLIDSPGVYGGAKGPEHNEVDKYLADSGAHAVENLVRLDTLPGTEFKLYCFPIYMSDRNNAPCRVVADFR